MTPGMRLNPCAHERLRAKRLLLTGTVLAGLLFGPTAVMAGTLVDIPSYVGDGQEFAAAQGERALMMGYPDGLEIWAYPLQLLNNYKVRFYVDGQVSAIEGAGLLRRVEHSSTEIVRVYVGPDFVIREHLFVPRHEAAAIIRYEVSGRPKVKLEVSFQPSLDLMWPGALGGQSVGWEEALTGYLEQEPLHDFSATIASQETVEHDAIRNDTRPSPTRLNMVMEPRSAAGEIRIATLYVIANPPRALAAGVLAGLVRRADMLRAEAGADVSRIQAEAIQIVTPDASVNRALASAVLAVDKSWVCNDAIGCGAVAGYGPSRPGRRPQYAWFFAGDGLVAMQGMLAAGQFDRARTELEFITHYQNRQTGMIWHEMSQSAALIDWEKNYPYMFVHVDITFQYLAAVRDYVARTGDTRFAVDHWHSILAAYRYCASLISRKTDLPQIPPGKQGQNEQEQLRDDIRLSTLWIDAAASFADLAQATGHRTEVPEAVAMVERARKSVELQGWDDARGFWLSGHTLAGEPVHGERPDASGVLSQKVFSQDRIAIVLDRLASPEFQTDWGVRSLSAKDAGYNPNLYGSGSVWALGTASVATTFWQQHRPLTAWSLWRGLVAWDTLDSPGHLHEVLAGDLFHPEFESVPEQTWSSASLLTSAVQGLLGIEVRSAARKLTFAPHLPTEWPSVSVRNVVVGAQRVSLKLDHDHRGLSLEVDNPGADVNIDFDPALPLGAVLEDASVDGVAAVAQLEQHDQDSHARLRFAARRGTTHARIDFTGGIGVRIPSRQLRLGDPSSALKIVSATYANGAIAVDAWVMDPDHASFILSTGRRPVGADGASIGVLGGTDYAIRLEAVSPPIDTAGESHHVHALVRLDK